MMPKGDPRDGFFYPTFTLMIDSYKNIRTKVVIGGLWVTVNLEIFARILFSRIALKHIFATLKIRDKGVIYLYQ